MIPMPFPTLCLVTNRTFNREMTLEDTIEYAIDGGIDMVQLREKELTRDELLRSADKLRSITSGRSKFLVNSNLEVAIKSGADGIHLPQNSTISVSDIRRSTPNHFLIGKSAHDQASATAAARDGVDYIILGTIFPTDSKPGVETGGTLRSSEISANIDCPILAIGGINADNINSVISAGAYGAAISGAILSAKDPKKQAMLLRANCNVIM